MGNRLNGLFHNNLSARSTWMPVSLLLSAALVGGYAFRAVQNNSPSVLVASILLIAVATLALSLVLARLLPTAFDWLERKRSASWNPNRRRTLVVSALVIGLFWLPVLLAGFPGFFNYDAGMKGQMQWAQVERGVYNDHHPILHTLWLEYTVKLGAHLFGDFNAGICLSVVLQAVLLLAVIVWALSKMLKDGCSRMGFVLAVAFFALNPMVSFFAFSTTKDVPCAASALVLCISLREAIGGGESSTPIAKRMNALRIVVCSALCASLRSNVLIALLLFLVVLVCAKKYICHAREICLFLALGLVLSVVWSASSSYLLGVKKSPIGAWNSMGLPMQCLARCTQDGAVSQSDKDHIHDMLGDVAYKWNLSDRARRAFVSYKGSKKELIKTWISMGMKYPLVYVDAILLHTEDAWNPFSVIDGYSDYGSTRTCVFEFDTKQPGCMQSKLPELAALYAWISSETGPERVLPLSLLISIPFYIYAILVCAVRIKERACLASYYPCLLLLIITLTNIAGPVMLIRYFLYLVLALPIVIHWALSAHAEQAA